MERAYGSVHVCRKRFRQQYQNTKADPLQHVPQCFPNAFKSIIAMGGVGAARLLANTRATCVRDQWYNCRHKSRAVARPLRCCCAAGDSWPCVLLFLRWSTSRSAVQPARKGKLLSL